MISRNWKGLVKPELAESYINHLKTDTFPKLSNISGFVRASILKREFSEGTEFLIITLWESLEAIEHFAGKPADIAVVPEVAQRMMISYDKKVAHYEIVEEY